MHGGLIQYQMFIKISITGVNHFKSNLSGDIETNPGPVINSSKTIQAPFSQDNVAMFGSNAGTQCIGGNGIVSSMESKYHEH